MIVRIDLIDDKGNLIIRKEGDASRPLNFRTPDDMPLFHPRFNIFGYTFQPIALLRPLEPTR